MTPIRLAWLLLLVIAVLGLVWAFLIAQGTRCAMCWRGFALFDGERMGRYDGNRCWRHRPRRAVK